MSTMIPTYQDDSSKKTKYKHLKAGSYPARLVRFIGLGLQEQPEWNGEKKRPAFKVATQWQLYDPMEPSKILYGIELKANDDGTVSEVLTDRASCQFQDYFLFPKAERGKVFDMCKAFEPTIQQTPGDLDWFFDKVGQAAMIQVRTYQRKDKSFGNAIEAVNPILPMLANMMPAATVDLVSFNPYVNDDTNALAYAKMFRFQHQILTEAMDSEHIPLAGTAPMKLDAVNAASSENSDGGADTSATENPFKDFEDDDVPF